jgi:archaellum component FlaC
MPFTSLIAGAELEKLNDLLLGGLVLLFSVHGLALILSFLIIASCALIVAWIWRERSQPLRGALRQRLDSLNAIMPDTLSAHDEEDVFANDFAKIDTILTANGPGALQLRRSWVEYRETLIFDGSHIRSTSQTEQFFTHIGDDIRLLGWWANIFVAIGLVFTFLGLVAALKVAADGMQGTQLAQQEAIPELLKIASSKFFTSIAGVASSIICRIAERRMRMAIKRDVAALSGYLERGLRYSPPQALAAEQLVQLREQTNALKIFKTELATSIGEQFERQNQPVISVLGDISKTLQQVKEEGFAELTGGIGDAISKNAGREMAALSDALTQMTHQFGSVHERIEAGGDIAGQRIKEAADQFAAASASMSLAFAELNDRIEAMATRMTDHGTAASNAAANRFDDLLGRYQGVAEGNAAIFEQGAAALHAAASSAGAAISEQVGRQLEAASARFASAAAGMDTAFTQLSARVSRQVEEAAERTQAQAQAGAARQERLLADMEVAGARNAEASVRAAQALSEAGTAAGAALSEAVGRQMEAASHQFALAARSMNTAFSELQARLEAQAARTESEARSASTRTAERFEQVLDGLEAVGRRNAQSFDLAAGALNKAAIDAAAAARHAVEESMAAATEQASDALRSTLGEFRETFARETRLLSLAVSEAVSRMTSLAQGIDQTTKAAGLQTQRMAETAQAAQAASASIAQAAGEFDRAAAPVRDSTRSVAEAMGQIGGALVASTEASRTAIEESRVLAEQIRTTASEAERAWQAYSSRFADVDKDLGDVLRQITDALKSNADHLTDHVNKIDKGLAEAVSKLVHHLEPISDLASQQEELIEELTKAHQHVRTTEPA